METDIGTEGQAGSETGRHLHMQFDRGGWIDPRKMGVAVTRPHEHWCAVCGIGLGGDA